MYMLVAAKFIDANVFEREMEGSNPEDENCKMEGIDVQCVQK